MAMKKKTTKRKTTKRKSPKKRAVRGSSKVTKVAKQRGKSKTKADKTRHALKAGKRKTAWGSTYWETRKNRSDSGGKKAKLGTKSAV